MPETPAWVLAKAMLISCACGCTAQLLDFDNKGRRRTFIQGHYSRVTNPGLSKITARSTAMRGKTQVMWRADGKHKRTARWRARSITDTSTCTLEHIGGCQGPIQVAHVSGDFTDNSEANRRALCVTHHRLLDNGRIDLANPVMPAFYTDGGGKRRYYKSN